jgi:hypothetical protein
MLKVSAMQLTEFFIEPDAIAVNVSFFYLDSSYLSPIPGTHPFHGTCRVITGLDTGRPMTRWNILPSSEERGLRFLLGLGHSADKPLWLAINYPSHRHPLTANLESSFLPRAFFFLAPPISSLL